MRTQTGMPPEFEKMLDDLMKLSEKYGAAAVRHDLAGAEALMASMKKTKSEIVLVASKHSDVSYEAGVEDGRISAVKHT